MLSFGGLVWISRGPYQQLCDSFNSNRYGLMCCKLAYNILSFKRTALIPVPGCHSAPAVRRYPQVSTPTSSLRWGPRGPYVSRVTGFPTQVTRELGSASRRMTMMCQHGVPLLPLHFYPWRPPELNPGKSSPPPHAERARRRRAHSPERPALRPCFPHRAAEGHGGESPRCATLLEAFLGSRRPVPPARPTQPGAAATHLHGIGEVELLRGASELLPGLVVRHGGAGTATRCPPLRSVPLLPAPARWRRRRAPPHRERTLPIGRREAAAQSRSAWLRDCGPARIAQSTQRPRRERRAAERLTLVAAPPSPRVPRFESRGSPTLGAPWRPFPRWLTGSGREGVRVARSLVPMEVCGSWALAPA